MTRLNNFYQRLNKCRYWQLYTVAFAIVSLLAFSWFYLNGRTFVWNVDGIAQHYRSLVYYAQYLRKIIVTLLKEHQLVIPSWDFAIGEGADILSTLHYYVIGDPFSFPAVFVPSNYIHIYYCIAIIARLYCAGIAFSFMCKEVGKTSKFSVLAGSLVYVFCFWNLYNVARHPYFINPLIYFPLLVAGAERILKNKSPFLFTVAVFLCVISNFYFLYMIAMLAIIYVLIRYGFEYKTNIKNAVRPFCITAASAVLGACMGAVILLPLLNTILGDTRLGGTHALHLFYPTEYYLQLPSLFVSPEISNWLCMGYAVPTLLAVMLLFRRRHEKTFLKILLGVCVLFLLFPIFGKIFNGFSYSANRWSWLMALIVSYILMTMWDDLMSLKSKDVAFLFAGTAIYLAICILIYSSRTIRTFTSLCLILVFLILLCPIYTESGRNVFGNGAKKILCLVLVIVNIAVNAFWFYSPYGSNYAAQSLESKNIQENFHRDEAQVLKEYMENKSFSRYSGELLTDNAALTSGLSTTQYYWTNSNSNITNFITQMEVPVPCAQKYNGYDGRAALLALTSVKYYVISRSFNDDNEEFDPKTDNDVPYGFKYIASVDAREDITDSTVDTLKKELGVENLTEDQVVVVNKSTVKKYDIYQNKNFLPLTYTYDTYMSRAEWEKLSAVDKQNAILQTAVLEEPPQYGLQISTPKNTSEQLEYEMEYNSEDVSFQDNRIVVTSPDAKVTFKFKGMKNSETYLNFTNLNFTESLKWDLYLGDDEFDPLNLYNKTNWNRLSPASKKDIKKKKRMQSPARKTALTVKTSANVTKSFEFYTPEHSYYSGRDSYSINLGYNKKKLNSVTVTFDKTGIYSFDSLSIVAQPMTDFKEQINERKAVKAENVKVKTDVVKGKITLDKPQLLCFSIPYSKGFTAYVDGEQVDIMRVNVKNMALSLDSGEHEFELRYSTPFLKLGFCVSAVSFVAFAALWLFSRKKKSGGETNALTDNGMI
ncbi:MAG: YfhO family protein [Ruminococcus sp.]|nr:YfhO family protein [Ruminococcus sp.]